MTVTAEKTNVKLIIEPVESAPLLAGLLDSLDWSRSPFVLGDFQPTGPGRFSYCSPAAAEIIEFDRSSTVDPLNMLESAYRKYNTAPVDLPVPFVGGWLGYLSYDLGRYIEKLPDSATDDIPLPLMRFGFYDHLLAYDKLSEIYHLIVLDYPGQKTAPKERLAELSRLCESKGPSHRRKIVPPPGPAESLIERMDRNIGRDDYLAKVRRAIEYIKAGDIFEVNLSQRFSCPYAPAGAGELYAYLAERNPAGYCAILGDGERMVVSSSPELFLKKRGSLITTRPIKGTIPRGSNEAEDLQNKQLLERSEKDIAELNMIIDLERNDLGRICSYGSVRLIQERTIEAHPTVYHAVSTIEGRLERDVSLADILRASFPGGSITGAPKIRAMEIIDQLEPTARSVYTGGIGWIGLNGDMELNIAIRTILIASGRAYLQVGGAVVADSDPAQEYDETLAKAAALGEAICATGKRQ